jgi:hypothetical protein
MDRTLVIRVPLQDKDPKDIIGEIDRSNVSLVDLIQDRYEDIYLNVETGDRAFN